LISSRVAVRVSPSTVYKLRKGPKYGGTRYPTGIVLTELWRVAGYTTARLTQDEFTMLEKYRRGHSKPRKSTLQSTELHA
jgi:hypothetical protein